MTSHHLTRRDYSVRAASTTDLPRLCELERLCWQHTRTPEAQIRARVAAYPHGQFVLEKNGTVLAAIYSQRIASAESLEGRTAANVHELHDPSGSIVQLLAINVDPEAQNLRLGDQFLELVLHRCSLMEGVDRVVGVTLCKRYDPKHGRPFAQYVRLQGAEQDPVLAFHQAHGACVVKPVAGYRPEDQVNEGYGVLVSYDIRNRAAKAAVPARAQTAQHESPRAEQQIAPFVRQTVAHMLGTDSRSLATDRPLMELGLDSADLLKLQEQIETHCGRVLQPTVFFEHNTIDKVVTHLTEGDQSVARMPVDGRGAVGTTDIAVIGMSCKLPGGIETPNQLWHALESGRSLTGRFPRARGSWPEDVDMPGIDQGGFVRDGAAFDCSFFRIPPKEALIIDPQQRIALELAWACLEDAAIVPSALKGTNTGVFIGASNSDYSRLIQAHGLQTQAHHATGNSLAVLANRLSYFFDFSGPSMLIDTACSASLVALHCAIQALRANECGAALVGGVNFICHPDLSIAYHKAGMLAADGKCKVFDAKANGYVRSEGAVMLLLKPLSSALAAGDRIHAVIKGSAVNHGGLAGGLTVPNPRKQSELLTAAWNNAGISARDLSYLEAHGTGTSLGDPIEIQGISTAITQLESNTPAQPCAVGSVKSNLGHLESAAGITGLLKVILSMQHRQIPATIHFEQLNPKIGLEGTPLYVADRHRQWEATGPRIAGVSSFGSGGTNSHVVVQEYAGESGGNRRDDDYLFVLSAATAERLREYAGKVRDWLEEIAEEDFADVIYTWQVGRAALKHRLAIKVTDRRDLQTRLTQWLAAQGTSTTTDTDPPPPQTRADPQAIEAAWSEGNLEQIGGIWAGGGEVDWQKLYTADPREAGMPRRAGLPTYPFARERYWIDVVQAAAEATVRDASVQLFFEECWEEQALVAPALPTEAAQTVIFADQGFVTSVTANGDARYLSEAVLVYRAQSYEQLSDRIHQGRFDDPSDFHRILDSVASRARAPISIVYTWAKGQGEAGLHALFNLFKAVKESAHRIVHVTLVGQYNPQSLESCWDYSWIGFERSLRLVLPQVRISLLYTSSSSCTSRQLLDASQSTGVIRYQDERRFVLYCKQISVDKAAGAPVLKKNGGYLITGGCGALGFKLAAYLAQKCQAKLLLVGRSPLCADIQQRLDALRRAGAAEAHYRAVDIGDRQVAPSWAEELPFTLSGIIHAAGCRSVRQFDEKSTHDINEVLRPKTVGTLLLDEMLAAQPLDFVCYFSSSAAILGDFGACDYAVANRFQMAYAGYRQAAMPSRGRTIVINWPLWREGGMGLGDAGQTELYLKSSGQEALETAAGLDIWHNILGTDRLQTLVMLGRAARVRDLLDRLYRAPAASPSHTPTAAGRDSTLQSRGLPLRQCVVSDVKELISACLGIAPDRLDEQANLADYGFDSIHLGDFARRLTAHYGVPVTPVVFFSYTTIQQLVGYFMAEHAERLLEVYRNSAGTASSPGRLLVHHAAAATAATTSATAGAQPIAIIGMSGRFPQARTVDQLWTLLAEGRSGITEIPPSRWDWRDYFVAPGDSDNRIATRLGGFIEGVAEFDPLFFEISPREAEEMDPAQRLLLMESYRAIEDAGLSPASLSGSKVGVFVGMEEGQYDSITGRQGITTSGNAMVSSRLSYFLDLRGPAIATNTACSSGLVAMHQAVASLRQGECHAALVAGVSLNLSAAGYVMMSQAGMLSPDGHCRSFAKGADGIGVGEAVVALLLKPLSAAVAARDNIYGIVKASGINFDGKTNGVTAPSGKMQAELIEDIYTRNGINVRNITHIVTHGTGTPLGDPVEISALNDVFRKLDAEPARGEHPAHCAITSCKSNVGHTLAASGLVSVVGLLQGMRHHRIPATLYCEAQSAYIPWTDSPFYINKVLREWRKEEGRAHLGAVSAFGRSGTNAHVVIEEYQPSADGTQAVGPIAPVIIPLSARTAEQLRQRARELLDFVLAPEAVAAPIDLQAMAHTLQVGRDAMTERVGFIVDSVTELAGKLQAYVSGEREIVGTRQGTSKRQKNALAVFGDDEDFRKIIDKWLDQKSLPKLLDLWVNGVEIDWDKLHGQVKPPRLRLPTYPFAREHYWAAAADSTRCAQPPGARSVLHPLLHQNTSDSSGQRYTSRFDGSEFFLRDHQVLGRKVLPGVAYLEMARAALERAVPGRSRSAVLELRNTVWIQPFIADPARRITIELLASAAGDDSLPGPIEYEIYSHEQDADAVPVREIVHCQGQASFTSASATIKLDIAGIKARTVAQELAGSGIYSDYRKRGLDYGPAFQGITAVFRGEGEVLACLRLPAACESGADDFLLHPCLMDGALQSAIALAPQLDSRSSQPSLPFELGSVRVLAGSQTQMLAWVRHCRGNRPKDGTVRLDIDLCDPEGNVCVQMRGFTSRAAAGQAEAVLPALEAVPLGQDVEPGSRCFVPVWNAASGEISWQVHLPESARILLLSGSPAELAWVRRSYPRTQLLSLPPDTPSDSIAAHLGQRSFDHLLWIAPDVAGESYSNADAEQVIARQERGVLQVFRIAKALLHAGYSASELQWTLITRNTQSVKESDRLVATHAGVSGLIGSLGKEYPHWRLRLLDLDGLESLSADECLSVGWNQQGHGYARRRGEWFRQELSYLASSPPTAPVYKHNGVYVVIGGAGGLGEVWSRHLIERYRAKIVWIGRRELDSTIEQKLRSLQALGDAPLYICADATNVDSLRKALETILRTYPHINGVVNSALVLRDKSLLGMEESRFKDSLASKVDVSVNMDRVFGELDLDFMLFFSSMMSFLRAPGQANYAAGCTFQDSFAHALRRKHAYPVKIMNWGYWGSAGVVSDDVHRRRMEQVGIGSIDPDEGLAALQTLLGVPLPQIVFYRSLNERALCDLNVTGMMECLPSAERVEVPVLSPDDRTAIPEKGWLPEGVESLAAQILASTLKSLGLAAEGGSGRAGVQLTRTIAALNERWLESSRLYLQHNGWLSGVSTFTQQVNSTEALWSDWENRRTHWIAAGNPSGPLELLEACLRALPDILSGKTTATEVMFPNSSMRLVEGVYGGNPTADYYNEVLTRALVAYIHRERPRTGGDVGIRILEVGAGTGATTARLLPALRELGAAVEEYCYTDVSKAFLMHAEEHYQPLFPALTTALFDVSKPLAHQSVGRGHYDVVIATNVLHATPDIRAALHNAKALLRSQGILLLNELSRWTLFNHLTFGLLPGWWLHQDSALRLPGSPALAPEKWAEVLAEEGFSSIAWPAGQAHELGQQVIAAISDGWLRQSIGVGPAAGKTDMSATPPPAAAMVCSEPAAPLREQTIAYLQRLIARSLKMNPEQLDPGEPLEKYGLDSILVVQLTNQMRTVLPDITSTLFFEAQSITGLADWLLEHKPEAVEALKAGSGSAPEPRRTAALPSRAASFERPARAFAASRSNLRRAQQPLEAIRPVFDVAIIGCSGRYPRSGNLDAFWEHLAQGENCVTEIPRDRWNWEEYFDAEKGKAGKIYTRWGGFLADIDKFDPLFFKISPKEAKGIDPQERVFLESCYHAIEDAGYTPETLGDIAKVGVFVGVMSSSYNPQPLYYSIANRVSYLFNFQGASMAVDTACSSSLTAIHLALESIYSGLSECAIAGGVNLVVDHVHYQELSALTMLSAGDQCRSFGAAADGFVAAEGVGAVVLKPLKKAQQDGDHIYGIIKGSAINAGGKTNGYTVPNPRAQSSVVRKALERAGIEAADLSYIEAHGTGTALGDPIEIAGLTRAFEESGDCKRSCAIGSVKSNIGHCEAAAGVAGLTKVLLQMKHRMLVPSLHAETPNPEINFAQTPFRVQKALEPWVRPAREVRGVVTEIPRIAGISSFGAGGSNAHVIVAEHVPAAAEPPAAAGPVIVPLSARTADRLGQKLLDLQTFIRASRRDGTAVDLVSMAYTLQVGREAMEERVGFVVGSIEELEERLDAYSRGERAICGMHAGQVRRNKDSTPLPGLDADPRQTLETAVRERDLAKLLQLWVKGLELDWSRLYGELRPKRLSLPAYPFERQRCWHEREGNSLSSPKQHLAAAFHPLIHRNVSNMEQQCYSSTFSGDELLLTGHATSRDDGPQQTVIPAVIYLEMARVAIEDATSQRIRPCAGRGTLELYDIVWADPAAVVANRQVAVALFANGINGLSYEIYSPASDSAAETVHCQGQVCFDRPHAPVTLDIEQLKSQMQRAGVDAASRYESLSAAGMRYAATYRGITSIHGGDNQLLAQISLPGTVLDDRSVANEDFILHPVMMDSALQAAFGLLSPDNQPSLPLGLEVLRIFSACPTQMFAWVRHAAGANSPRGGTKLDIDLCDLRGNVCIQMRGVTYEAQTKLDLADRSSADAGSQLCAAPARPARVALAEPERETFAPRVAAKPTVVPLA
jgi:acyl transferase domain-containing protein/aryl carrier-like protein/SAM-dependent methyltransferase